jgi:hypothetical protein
MQDRLSRYIRTRTGILTAMSHDLKTPITRLRLRAELLEQPETREKFVRDLVEMENMVNSTLGYMRGLDDRESLRAVDVRALAEALQADAEDSGPVRVTGQPIGPFFGKSEGPALQNPGQRLARLWIRRNWRSRDSVEALTLIVRDHGPVFRGPARTRSSRSIGSSPHATRPPAAPDWACPLPATLRSPWAVRSRSQITLAAGWRREWSCHGPTRKARRPRRHRYRYPGGRDSPPAVDGLTLAARHLGPASLLPGTWPESGRLNAGLVGLAQSLFFLLFFLARSFWRFSY